MKNPLPVKSKMANGTQIGHIKIAITLPRINSISLKFGTCLRTPRPVQYKRSRSKDQRSRSQRDARCRQQNVISQERIGWPISSYVWVSKLNEERSSGTTSDRLELQCKGYR